MAQPTPYVKATNFQEEEANNVAGRSTVRTAMVDAELAGIELTLSQVLGNLALIQRDDTALQDEIVTTESLSPEVKLLFGAGGITPRGAWLTATSYAVKDVVETGTPLVSYICVIAHTSGTFATDRAAGKWMVLGAEPGAGTFTSITLTTGGVTLGTNNTQDLAATANRFRSGYFGTSLFAAVSVVTPLVGTDTATQLNFKTNGTSRWGVASAGTLIPFADATYDLGTPSFRVINVFATAIDSGTTGSLSFKTNNGTTQFTVSNTAVATIGQGGGNVGAFLTIQGWGTVNRNWQINVDGATAGLRFTASTAPGGTTFAGETALGLVEVASSTRWITIAGSNGGNPTIGVTAGSLAITPAVVLASTLQVATTIGVGAATPSASGAGITFPATQSNSSDNNTLDDYEEGSWTPTLGGSATYSLQQGIYTKIGNKVWFELRLTVNTIGTGSTNIISGLPFAAVALPGVLVSYFATAAGSYVYLVGDITSTSIVMNGLTAAATGITTGASVFQNGTAIRMSGCYLI